jgi:HSP90 family molecular chaperone
MHTSPCLTLHIADTLYYSLYNTIPHTLYYTIQEINPRHPLIAKLNELVSFDAESKEAADLAWLMFDTAMAASGFTIEKIDDFSARMYRYVCMLLHNNLNTRSNEDARMV